MATDDYLVQQLRAWGHAQANRFALTYADRSTHVLEKATWRLAPGKGRCATWWAEMDPAAGGSWRPQRRGGHGHAAGVGG